MDVVNIILYLMIVVSSRKDFLAQNIVKISIKGQVEELKSQVNYALPNWRLKMVEPDFILDIKIVDLLLSFLKWYYDKFRLDMAGTLHKGQENNRQWGTNTR